MRLKNFITEFGYKKANKKQAQVKFNADVQKEVQRLGGHPGKIDWDTVTHLFNTGKDVKYTAKRAKEIQDGK